MESLLEEAEVLRENGQSKDLVQLVDMLLPQFTGSDSLDHWTLPSRTAMSISTVVSPEPLPSSQLAHYQLIIYYADALLATKNYRPAKRYYESALSMRKQLINNYQQHNQQQQQQRLQTTGKKRSAPGNGSSLPAPASTPAQTAPPVSGGVDCFSSEIRLKVSIAKCQEKMEDYNDATATLESIPRKLRTLPIHLTLASLYSRENSNCNSDYVQVRGSSSAAARQVYREILTASPLSLDAAKQLIRLGEKSADVLAMMQPALDRHPALASWIPNWVEANSMLYSTRTEKSIPLFEQLIAQLNDGSSSTSSLAQSLRISLAEAHYFVGNYKKVINILKESVIDKYGVISPAIDMIAASFYHTAAYAELEGLASRITSHCSSAEKSSAIWIALAYYCFSQNKARDSKALYFVQQSSFCSRSTGSGGASTPIEALLLKGVIMSSGRNFPEAINYLIEAFNAAPYRFDTHKALADVYIADGRKQLAQQIAQNAFSRFGKTPATLTLSPSILLSSGSNTTTAAAGGESAATTGGTVTGVSSAVAQQQRKQARTQLEQAVRQEPAYIPAVVLLSNVYNDEKLNDKNLELLTGAIQLEPSNTKLHRMLGELYIALNDQDKALHHHNIATKIEMNLRSSTSGSLGGPGSLEPSQRLTSAAQQQQAAQQQLENSAMMSGSGGGGITLGAGGHGEDLSGVGVQGTSAVRGALDMDEGGLEEGDSDMGDALDDEELEESLDTTAEEMTTGAESQDQDTEMMLALAVSRTTAEAAAAASIASATSAATTPSGGGGTTSGESASHSASIRELLDEAIGESETISTTPSGLGNQDADFL